MKNKVLFLFILLYINILTNGCKKRVEDQNNIGCKNVSYLVANSKAYFHFKTGSWWVYRNTLTNVKDSFWVEKEGREMVKSVVEGDENFCREKVFTQISSKTFVNKTPYPLGHMYYIPLLRIEIGDEGVKEVYNILYRNVTYVVYRAVFTQDGEVSKSKKASTNLYSIDTLTLNGVSYKDLIFISNIVDGIPLKKVDWFYYAYVAKNIGYIQYTDLAGELWVLEQYKIVQ